MARRARKRWLGLTTVTQEVEDFLASPEGHTVLANSSVQMLVRQDSSAADWSPRPSGSPPGSGSS